MGSPTDTRFRGNGLQCHQRRRRPPVRPQRWWAAEPLYPVGSLLVGLTEFGIS